MYSLRRLTRPSCVRSCRYMSTAAVQAEHPKAIDTSVPGAPGSLEAPGFLKRNPSIVDLSNPKPFEEYDYAARYNVTFPCDFEIPRPTPTAQEGFHTHEGVGGWVKFPYLVNPAFDATIPIHEMMEVVAADAPRGPIDVFLDGFTIAELPKGPGQVYKMKGTDIGNVGINENVWYYPVVAFEDGSSQEYIDVTVDMLEVIDKDSEMDQLDTTNTLQSSLHNTLLNKAFFEAAQKKLPTDEGEVYKIKDEIMDNAALWKPFTVGEDMGALENQVSGTTFRHFKDSKLVKLSNIPQGMEARTFWRRYGTRISEALPDEQFDEIWVHFFCNPDIDRWELRRGANLYNNFDCTPEPTVLRAMLYACRRLNEFALTIRILEGLRYSCSGDKSTYDWAMQEIQPTLDELGIVGPEHLNLHIRPEQNIPHPF